MQECSSQYPQEETRKSPWKNYIILSKQERNWVKKRMVNSINNLTLQIKNFTKSRGRNTKISTIEFIGVPKILEVHCTEEKRWTEEKRISFFFILSQKFEFQMVPIDTNKIPDQGDLFFIKSQPAHFLILENFCLNDLVDYLPEKYYFVRGLKKFQIQYEIFKIKE